MKEKKLVAMPTNPNVMRFEVKLNSKCGGKVLKVEIERVLQKSENYYGNGTYVIVNVNGIQYAYFDTRYETEMNTVSGFQQYFTNWVAKQWSDNAESIKRIL